MNNSFSFRRLGLLIRKHGIENRRQYLITLFALLGCQAGFMLFWIFVMNRVHNEEHLFAFFGSGLYITGLVIASRSFTVLGDKPKGTYWMMTPATHAEKLVTAILFSSVFFFIAYTAGFFLLRIPVLAIVKAQSQGSFEPFRWENSTGKIVAAYLLSFFATQGWFLLGSVYFAKNSFVKTLLATAAIFFAGALYIHLLQRSLPDGRFFQVFDVVAFTGTNGEERHIYSAATWLVETFTFILKWSWLPVLWTVAWFRLKEKQL